ncbi:MAG: 23S rRNA (adenine(2503)-C(2))-methyltransferase RlmN [Verrucomicrobia bacterium]|nr:23S rRNA (adenine(2503)-C(2))-methyltransferase RlmN [Verrucomicrobiota bacterium]
MQDIRSVTREELLVQFENWQEPVYRVDQLLRWLYDARVNAWDEMTNLPKALRGKLSSTYSITHLALVQCQGARDTTRKFLWRLTDGAMIESVLIPASPALYGERSDRHTLCISTQVGCAYGCRFCASGLEGWKRNLRPEEIAGQILAIENLNRLERAQEKPSSGSAAVDRLINNIVVMGMGEPLANYAALMRAIQILNAPWGGGIGARKITVSTSGLAPQIRQLADEPLQLRLAISLHGATDEVRQKIMPVNRKYPLKELTEACEYYQEKKGRMITFEYILIAGVNDSIDQTRPLAALARRLHAKVNLIPYNKVDGLEWSRPEESVQEDFLGALESQNVTATLRREKGHDIDAACGQLRLRTERGQTQAE